MQSILTPSMQSTTTVTITYNAQMSHLPAPAVSILHHTSKHLFCETQHVRNTYAMVPFAKHVPLTYCKKVYALVLLYKNI